MNPRTPSDPDYAALGHALAAILGPMVQSAVTQALAQHTMPEALRPYANRLALRPQEAADALGLHRGTIDAEINAGRLLSKKLGHARIIPMTDLIAWLEQVDS